MRILVIDSSTAMRELVVHTLREHGHQDIEEAASPQAALERLAVEPFDVVVTDWGMSELSGPDFVRALRSLELSRTVPVVVVTAHATRDHVMAAVKAGVNGYIVKPFTSDTLREKIEAAAASYAASDV